MQAGSVGRAIFSRTKARISLGLVALGLCLTQSQTWAACSGEFTVNTATPAQPNTGSSTWLCSLTITESGSISVTNTDGFSNSLGRTITTLNNNGQISASGNTGTGINNYGTITTLNNSNQISAGGYAIMNRFTGTINTLNNTGSITAPLAGQIPPSLARSNSPT